MEALRRVLRPEGLKRLETVIVSHFDADHWEGLRLLAVDALPSHLASSVTIAYPRLPDRAPDTFAAERALFATVMGTGVRSLDFLNVWSKKTSVFPDPLCRDRRFRAANRDWHVLWPPRQLAASGQRALVGAVRAVEDLANRMAADGDRTLLDNLGAARQSALSRRELDDLPEQRERPEERSEQPPLLEVDEFDCAERDEREDDDGLAAPPGRFPDLSEIPDRHRQAFTHVSRRLARANNNLSLIMHDDGHLIAFGDAQRHVLRQALVGAPTQFAVALAPHHGSVEVPTPGGFPKARACVAQAGIRHRDHWLRHVKTHGQDRSCISTADVGTVSFW